MLCEMRLLLSFLLCWVLCEGQTVTFDLSDYDPQNKTTHVKKMYFNLTEGDMDVEVINIPEEIGFFVVQIHSYVANVSLSSSSKFKDSTTVVGTNIGLVWLSKKDATFYVKSKTEHSIFIVLILYEPEDPIPGGCNLTFNTENAPYQLVSFTDDLIIVESQAPSVSGVPCENNSVQVDMYHVYLHENRYDPSYYFKGIETMLTVDSITANGYKVRTDDGYFKYHKLYSAYRGVGQIFAIVATYRNRSSAYVSAISYGCDLTNLNESCYGPVTWHWKLICAFMLIFGFFICFFGHRFFRFTLYVMGCTMGIFLTYVILAFKNHLTVGDKTTASILLGLIYGSVWLLIWWKFGIPILSVALTFFMAGFLIASIVYYAGVADLAVFHSDLNFWLTFLAMIVAFYAFCTMFTLEGHVFGCSVLGAYACVAALNYYTGGNLQYIVINSFRRIAVDDFNKATIDPPFQILDIAQSLLLVVLTTLGFYYQMKEHRGKPPFPPHRYSVVEEGVMTETTPLISNSGVIYSDI